MILLLILLGILDRDVMDLGLVARARDLVRFESKTILDLIL